MAETKALGSPAGKLYKEDLIKVGKGMLIAAGGAVATYLLEMVPTIDFGVWTPIVVAVNSALVNLIRKLIVDHTVKK